jgi:hypothetical protein
MCEVHSRGTFIRWLDHRQALLGFASREALAEASGIAPATMRRIVERGSLQRVSRSARGYLARSLEVSLRDLEELAAGKVAWIADGQRVNWSRWTSDCLRLSRPDRREENNGPMAVPTARGVPIVGRIIPGGAAHLLEESAWGDVPRLPVRYKGAPDAFALRAQGQIDRFAADVTIVFRGLPPGELCAGEASLFTRADGDGETLLCQVEQVRDGQLYFQRADQTGPSQIPLELIHRAARVIGEHRARLIQDEHEERQE